MSSNPPSPAQDQAIIDGLTDGPVVTCDDASGNLALESDHTDWRRRIESLPGPGRDRATSLGTLLKANSQRRRITDAADGVTVRGGATVGCWPSDAALVADVAAFVTLGEWLPGRDERESVERDDGATPGLLRGVPELQQADSAVDRGQRAPDTLL